ATIDSTSGTTHSPPTPRLATTMSQPRPPATPPERCQPRSGTVPPAKPSTTIHTIDTTENVPTREPRTVERGSVARPRGRSRGSPCDSLHRIPGSIVPQSSRSFSGPNVARPDRKLKRTPASLPRSSPTGSGGQTGCPIRLTAQPSVAVAVPPPPSYFAAALSRHTAGNRRSSARI